MRLMVVNCSNLSNSHHNATVVTRSHVHPLILESSNLCKTQLKVPGLMTSWYEWLFSTLFSASHHVITISSIVGQCLFVSWHISFMTDLCIHCMCVFSVLSNLWPGEDDAAGTVRELQ